MRSPGLSFINNRSLSLGRMWIGNDNYRCHGDVAGDKEEMLDNRCRAMWWGPTCRSWRVVGDDDYYYYHHYGDDVDDDDNEVGDDDDDEVGDNDDNDDDDDVENNEAFVNAILESGSICLIVWNGFNCLIIYLIKMVMNKLW